MDANLDGFDFLRTLLSFPTRRSSDLSPRSWRYARRSCSGCMGSTGGRWGDGSGRGGDRKSTRLNSSHTVISYAVFCLKKKKDVEPNLLYINTQLGLHLMTVASDPLIG